MFRLGLIGAGRMGQTHLRALANSSSVKVAAIVEPRAEVAAELAAKGHQVFANIGQLLAADAVDGFLVAVPSALHLGSIHELLPAKLPILCEKPTGLSSIEAGKIKTMVEAAGVRLQIGYWRRFLPQLQQLKARIEAGSFGKLLLIQCNQWDSAPPAAAFRNTSGGIFKDMGVHEIDQVRWLTSSEIVSLGARELMSHEVGVEDQDSAVIEMQLGDQTLALATLGRFYPEADYVGVEVFGSLGHERIDLLDATVGDGPQLAALLAQAEAFAEGANPNAANIDDAIAALTAVETATSFITEKSKK